MKINQNISDRINLLRFPLIIGVILIHSYGSEILYSSGSSVAPNHMPYIAIFIQTVISRVFAASSVPLFFIISGFLYFKNFSFSFESYTAKMKSRIRSLIIPYILWNLFSILVYVTIQSIPLFDPFFSGNTMKITDYNLYDFLNAFLGFEITPNSPVAYQFWFIRDLLILNFLSPIILIGIRYLKSFFILCLFPLWFLWPEFKYFNVNYSAIFFYSAGAFISYFSINLNSKVFKTSLFSIFYLILALCDAHFLIKGSCFSDYYHRVVILFGVLAVWQLSGCLLKKDMLKKVLTVAPGSVFFLFAVHEPFLLTGIRKISFRLIEPQHFIPVTILYFCIPSLVIIISLVIDTLLIKKMPCFYSIITGRR